MQTECSADLFGFAPVEGRAVVAGFDGGKMTSEAGGLLLGATDRAIRLVDRFADCFADSRTPELIEHTVETLVGQRVFALALGYEDLIDHDELRHDPTMAVLAGKLSARRKDCAPLAGKSTLNRLERRWNVALENVQGIEREMAASAALRSSPLDEQQKQQLMALGADLARAWSHSAATAATRKRILRACLDEIIVRKDGEGLDMVLRWHGGDHTALKLRVKLNASGRSYNPVTDDLIAIVRELARLMPDRQIARLLNRSGTQMASGKAWTEQSVHGFRKHRDIAPYRDGEWAERAEITLEAAAKIIGVCN